jgi:hypothetical protein
MKPIDLQAGQLAAAIRARSGPAPAPQIVWIFVAARGTWCVLRRAESGGPIVTLCCDAVAAAPVTIATSSLDPADRPGDTCPACETELAAGTPGAAMTTEPAAPVVGPAVALDLSPAVGSDPEIDLEALTAPAASRVVAVDLRGPRAEVDPVAAWEHDALDLDSAFDSLNDLRIPEES